MLDERQQGKNLDVKNTYKTTGPRNAYDKGGWENETVGDYGKKSINKY